MAFQGICILKKVRCGPLFSLSYFLVQPYGPQRERRDQDGKGPAGYLPTESFSAKLLEALAVQQCGTLVRCSTWQLPACKFLAAGCTLSGIVAWASMVKLTNLRSVLGPLHPGSLRGLRVYQLVAS